MPTKIFLTLLCFGLIASFLLLSEHRAHALGMLPYALVLACPLLHVFLHTGHKHNHQHEEKPVAPLSKHDHDKQ